ncbi:hypothetical protein [Bradyrhizobium sp. CCGUVB23]|uniref:hypothetical protein n=1 Tax=Bradyrhizobium sp. CCGUVB23 TaxID=2949630 RepID=UPI0020B3FFF2|nr:hypothetical protein [Bradyrhizobium sp. CCGUVB23]MCP3463688.1 hypothetical protein [Bradyrhizobium sp. CCGUVB23]
MQIKTVYLTKPNSGQWAGRSLTLAASFSLTVAAAVTISTGPVAAACVQSGSTVSCDGASTTGFGTGVENNLTVTVQSNASITVGPAQPAIYVADGNTVLNSGSITSVGFTGMEGLNNNTFTNAGTIAIGSNSWAMAALGTNNVFTNTGTITSTGVSAIGIGRHQGHQHRYYRELRHYHGRRQQRRQQYRALLGVEQQPYQHRLDHGRRDEQHRCPSWGQRQYRDQQRRHQGGLERLFAVLPRVHRQRRHQ